MNLGLTGSSPLCAVVVGKKEVAEELTGGQGEAY